MLRSLLTAMDMDHSLHNQLYRNAGSIFLAPLLVPENQNTNEFIIDLNWFCFRQRVDEAYYVEYCTVNRLTESYDSHWQSLY